MLCIGCPSCFCALPAALAWCLTEVCAGQTETCLLHSFAPVTVAVLRKRAPAEQSGMSFVAAGYCCVAPGRTPVSRWRTRCGCMLTPGRQAPHSPCVVDLKQESGG